MTAPRDGDTDGDFPAVAEHRPLTRAEIRRQRSLTPIFVAVLVQGDFDDGNGMWLLGTESPSDLG